MCTTGRAAPHHLWLPECPGIIVRRQRAFARALWLYPVSWAWNPSGRKMDTRDDPAQSTA